MTYQLPPEVASWSTVFRELESNKSDLGIVDYSVSQTSLEQVSRIVAVCDCMVSQYFHTLLFSVQVFLQFAKVQKFDAGN